MESTQLYTISPVSWKNCQAFSAKPSWDKVASLVTEIFSNLGTMLLNGLKHIANWYLQRTAVQEPIFLEKKEAVIEMPVEVPTPVITLLPEPDVQKPVVVEQQPAVEPIDEDQLSELPVEPSVERILIATAVNSGSNEEIDALTFEIEEVASQSSALRKQLEAAERSSLPKEVTDKLRALKKTDLTWQNALKLGVAAAFIAAPLAIYSFNR